MYRAKVTLLQSGLEMASPYSAYSTALLTAPTRTVIKDPYLRWPPTVVAIPAGDQRDRSEDAAVFHPIGRDGAPVRVRDWLSGRDGSLSFAVRTDGELAALEAVLAADEPVLVQWSEGGQSYLLVTNYTTTRVVRSGLHRISVSCLHTVRP